MVLFIVEFWNLFVFSCSNVIIFKYVAILILMTASGTTLDKHSIFDQF